MATVAQPGARSGASGGGFPRPSVRGVWIGLAIVALVWASMAVQAAILSDRQSSGDATLKKELEAAQAKIGQTQPYAFTTEVSAQAKAQPFDATLPPATAAPIKEITLAATDKTLIGIAKDINFTGWSFGDTIPSRPLHVRQGDTVHFTLTNNGSVGHGMDFHAAEIDPGKNYKVVLPGESFSFDWVANRPGVFMFHCSAAPVIEHIANGMYGAIIVDPPTPLPPAREYALVQSEYYLAKQGDAYSGDMNKMMAATPDYVVFNGMVNQYREHPLTANPGELVRLWVVNAGPSQTSAFHVIGTIFSAVYPDGNPANKLTGMQTYSIPPGGGAMFELTIPNEGTYPFVTHSFADASKGAIGVLQVGQPAAAAADVHNMNAPAPAAGAPLAMTMTDNKFDQKQLNAKVGEALTITLTNKGAALHNLHVLGLTGADGKDLVKTALIDAGKSGSVTFTPTKAGTYKFQCDVHVADMTGTLTVK